MKKVISATLIVAAGVLVSIVAIKLYNLYPKEITVSEVQQEESPYLVFLNEEEKKALQASRAESRAAEEPAPVAEKSAEEDVEAVPEMSAELKSYIASAQPEKIMEFFAQARRERAEKLQAIMENESIDQEWEDQMKQYLANAEMMLPQLKGITLITTDCRETICALEVDYGKDVKNYKQIEPYMSNIGSIVGLDTWVHHDALPHGGVIYFARENAELPEMRKI